MNRPLAWLAGFFSLGIALQYVIKLDIIILLIAPLVLMALWLLSLRRHPSSAGIICLLWVMGGALWLAVADSQNVSRLGQLEGKRLSLQGMIVTYPEELENKVVFDMMVDRIQLGSQKWQKLPREKVRVYLFASEERDTEDLRGTQATVPTKETKQLVGIRQAQQAQETNHLIPTTQVEPVKWAKKPAYENVVMVYGKLVLPRGRRNPGEFDFRQYLKFRNIHSLLYVYQPEKMTINRKAGGSCINHLISFTINLREKFSAAVHARLSHRQAVVLLAMLFGEQGAVYEDDLEMFRETGTAHALSVSGLHVGLVLLLVLGICRALGCSLRTALTASALGLCCYSIVSAFTVTVVRAAIMGIIALLAYYFDRERNVYTALAASALFILIWNPYFLFDPGFQLSFAAVWAMAYLEPLLRSLLPDFLYPYGSLVAVPGAAQLGTLPIVAWHFNTISLLAVLANILLVPVMSGIVIIGLLAFIVSGIPLVADIFLQTAGFLIEVLLLSGSWISKLPGRLYYTAPPSFIRIIVFYSLIVIAVELWSGRLKIPSRAAEISSSLRQWGSIVLLAWALLPAMLQSGPRGELRIFFLDVGQGDAILIQGPSGSTALVDGGGMPPWYGQGYDPGKDTVLPFLRGQGINRVDLLISTHPDDDHLDGLEDVLEAMPVRLVVTPPLKGWEVKYDSFLKKSREKGVPHTALSKGGQIKLDGEVAIKVLAPENPQDFQSSNDASLVLKVIHGENRFLLLGDLETEGIRNLMAGNTDLNCTLIKIPHHGAKGSFNEDLYKQTDAEIAVISVGQNNTFGHPSKEVVEYWDFAGDLYRTDADGCVIVASDGQRCLVETVQGGPNRPKLP